VKTRILFIIGTLDAGGAERQLIELARSLSTTFEVAVCTFYSGGALAPTLEASPEVRRYSLGKTGRWDLRALTRMHGIVAEFRPDIVHGYMPVANEVALLVGRLSRAKVVWGIRASRAEPADDDRLQRLVKRVGNRLARYPDLVICNSSAGRDYCATLGYPAARMVVIPNGIDTDHFSPDAEAGRRQRAAWGVSPEARLIGLVARLHPMKSHATFLRAAALISREHPEVRFVSVGTGRRRFEAEVRAMATELGLGDRVIWAGATSNVRDVYRACDVCTLTSAYGEGFPNVLAEAMACGVPCVATDVGDSRMILGELGAVVPTNAHEALAAAWAAALRSPVSTDPEARAALRARVMENFSRQKLTERTAEVLGSLRRSTRTRDEDVDG